jgi:hypothetical protein
MRWPWVKRAPPPQIPPYPVPLQVKRRAPEADGLVVVEHDTSGMTRTGVHKAWKRLTV